MKLPFAAQRPLSLSPYNLIPIPPPKHLCSSSLFSLPNSSLSTVNLQTSPYSMAACIDPSRTPNPHLSRHPNSPRASDNGFHHLEFWRPAISNRISHVPTKVKGDDIKKTIHTRPPLDDRHQEAHRDDVWTKLQEEAKSVVEREPILSNYYHSSILSHRSIEAALANLLSIKLSNPSLPSKTLFDLFASVLENDSEIVDSVKEDLLAVKERDPACISHVHCFLSFKGFLACQSHRIAHKLWSQDRKTLALLIQSRVSESFSVDIHPGAMIGRAVLLDHATGLVIGETAVVGNNVSILHGVTLGGTGKQGGDRHPKIGDGVLIGAGTCILGNIRIGEGAKIGAGSVVVKDVPARTTAVGNPARLLGGKDNPIKLDTDPGLTMDHTSGISEWSDYVI